jgi:hypothetical protein
MTCKVGRLGPLAAALDIIAADGAPALDLGETRPKSLNDAAHAITELNERFKNRLTLDNPRFVNHYL